MDHRTLETVVIVSCLVVLVTASALPWKTVGGREAAVATPPANEYFMGAYQARAMCNVEQNGAGLLFIKDANDVIDILELLRNTSINAAERPKRLYISRYRNSSNYYQATWLETDSPQYDIPTADIVEDCPSGYTVSGDACFAAYNTTALPYTDATSQCAMMMDGGMLTSIKTAGQWDDITSTLYTGEMYYIGAKYDTSDWAWEDGEDVDESFMPTQGTLIDQDCAVLSYNGTDWVLQTEACANSHPYVCSAPMDAGKRCMVIESPSGDWYDMESAGSGNDVIFRHEYCCLPEQMVDGALCTQSVSSSIDVGQLLNDSCVGGCGEGWFTFNNTCFTAININSAAVTPAVSGVYEAQRACYSSSPAADLVSSIGDRHTHSFIARLLNRKDMSIFADDLVYLGLNDIGRGSYMDHTGMAMYGYLSDMWMGPDNQALTVGGAAGTEDCVVLNATGGGWLDLGRQTVGDVSCCEDLMVTWTICERPVDENVNVVDAQMNPYAKQCYEYINDCQSVACNNGSCWDKILEYKCNCTLGFEGDHCETDIDYCTGGGEPRVAPCVVDNIAPEGCVEWVDAAQGIEAVNCTCAHAGINGTTCDTIWNPCGSNPCNWDAVCDVTYFVDYTCECPEGTTGINCETNLDDCLPENMNVTCYNGGTCSDTAGKLNEATCECAVGFIGLYCDTEVKCTSDLLPSGMANSDLTYNVTDVIYTDPSTDVKNFRLHSEIMMKCYSGNKYSDGEVEKNITCGQSDWIYPENLDKSSFPDCEHHCGMHPVLMNGDKESNASKVGTVMTYACFEGYRFADNSSSWNTTCLASTTTGEWGSWSPQEAPECEVMYCPELPRYDHQFLDSVNRTHNTTITFWCAVGYELYDGTTARTLRCMFGRWTAELPRCNPVKCPEIDMYSLTAISRNSSEREYNTYVKYECDAGQRMVDGGTYRILKCDASKEWSDEVTSCGFDRCYPLPYVVNATATTNNATCSHGPITLNCDPGHRFFEQDIYGNDIVASSADSKTIQCMCDTAKHQWRPLTIKACKPVNCPVFGLPLNAYRSTENTLYGTVLGIMCDKGHYYDAPTYHNAIYTWCNGDAEWNITEVDVPGECWPIQCFDPPTVKNGTRRFVDSTGGLVSAIPAKLNYTEQIEYHCDEGTKFIDGTTSRSIHCNEVGNFSDYDVSCIVERCNPVPEGANAEPNTTDTAWYTAVSYSCKAGFEWESTLLSLDYEYTTLCQVTGSITAEWTAQNEVQGVGSGVPVCVPKKCEPEDPPEHSTANITGRHAFNTVKEITCNTGYTFKYYGKIKTMYKQCNEFKQWEWIMDGVSLDPAYPIPSQYVNEPEVCIILECPRDPVAYLRHVETPRLAYIPWFQSFPWAWGNVTNATLSNDTYRYDQVASYTCIDGYQYENKDLERSFRCNENETWEYLRPEPYINDAYRSLGSYWCEVKFCPPVPEWSYNITYTNESNSNEFESVITYACKNDQVFSNCTGLTAGEICQTPRTTKCMESKQWEPAFDKCQSVTSIGAELVGFRAEAPNSVAFGTFACTLLSIMMACLILLDLNKLYTDCKMMKSNISSMMNKNNKVSDSSAGLQSESTA